MKSENKINWIICAIGGTESWTYKNSWTLKFHDDAIVDNIDKRFFHGPSLSGLHNKGKFTKDPLVIPKNEMYNCFSGELIESGTTEIKDRSFNWIKNRVGYYKSKNVNYRVVLVGHSRGGYIAILVASLLKELNIPVYFLGLFDAVDRDVRNTNTDIPTNVNYVIHALRNKFPSRWWMGNTGRILDKKNNSKTIYEEKIFDTSHGGVDGFPGMRPDIKGIINDNSDYKKVIKGYKNSPGRYGMINNVPIFEFEIDYKRQAESGAAGMWIFSKAALLGIPLKGINTVAVNYKKNDITERLA